MSLITTRDHCREMADRATTTAGDRALWTQLADEIDTYLEQTRTSPAEPLFGEA